MTTEEGQASPLLDLLEKLPDLFDAEVLRRLDPADRAFFAQVSHGCREAMIASELPCAGTRVGLPHLSPADRAQELARAVRRFDPAMGYIGYVASSDVPRAGGVVRLELSEFCTSAGRLALAKASGCQWDGWVCTLAAQGGHLEALRWAREHGCPWSGRACLYAAEGGHLDLLKSVRAHGCPWGEESIVCYTAARGGHLEVLQWLRERGCSWGVSTCCAAAREGHLELLKWAREHGCLWDAFLVRATANGIAVHADPLKPTL